MSTAQVKIERFTIGRRWIWPAVGMALAAIAACGWRIGAFEKLRERFTAGSVPDTSSDQTAAKGSHHDHDHPPNPDLLELSPQARASLGVQLTTVELGPFERAITVPAMIVERPGRSRCQVTALLTGVVSRILVVPGQAVEPGQVMFQLRLTHEELVQSQADFLRTAEELDVIGREVDRLESLAKDGSIAGKALLERKYEQQKAQAALRAQRQALVLHGFSNEQVDGILRTRTLLQFLDVQAPLAEMTSGTETEPMYQVVSLNVERGQHVNAGDTLAELADHKLLFIEGMAFERDISALHDLARHDWKIKAVLDSNSAPEVVDGLDFEFLDAQVEPQSRALHFYVRLPNEQLPHERADDRPRFITWRFKPGQRVQLRVPVEQLTDRIVLPAAAVAKDGLESFVFRAKRGNFVRRAVRVEFEDPYSVVIANDGSLRPGDRVAAGSAQQLLLALNNQSAVAVDPHAGHTH